MRVHINLDDHIVAELDRRGGPRRRSSLIEEFVRRGLEDEQRWDDVEAALGALTPTTHDWDDDPAAWVRAQRHADQRRAG